MCSSLRLCLVLTAVAATACTVGDVTERRDTDPDGGSGDDPTAPDADPTAPDAQVPDPVACEPAASALPNGEHNPGQACLTCHDGVGAPRFTLAGTLYGPGGTVALPAATIVVVDSAGVTLELITASNGNFYTAQTLTWPVMTGASKCPDTHAMIASVSDGNCNSCHTAAATPGRIRLP